LEERVRIDISAMLIEVSLQGAFALIHELDLHPGSPNAESRYQEELKVDE